MKKHNNKQCPFCGIEIKEEEFVIVCPSCGIAHHQDCWENHGGCTTPGCANKPQDAQHMEEQDIDSNDISTNVVGRNSFMFDNIGKKIQNVAKVICWIGIIASIYTGISILYSSFNYSYFGYQVFVGPIVGILGCLLSWLSSLLIYGFGKLVEDTEAIRNNISPPLK